jgi:cell division protein FtsA
MYATCIGLILKGYNIYEKTHAPLYNALLQQDEEPAVETKVSTEGGAVVVVTNNGKKRKTLKDFMNGIKDGLVDLFKEEGDQHL